MKYSDFSQQADSELTEKERKLVAANTAKIAADEYGFTKLVKTNAYADEVLQTLDQLGNWWSTLVVVGIGGSDLGGRAIQQALDRPHLDSKEVVFLGEETDPDSLQRFLAEYDTQDILFNIVSKSGKTTETMAFYQFFKQVTQSWAQPQSGDWSRHFIFTTSADSGLLLQEASKYQIPILAIPEDVGGRFSVLSSVGLLPAAAMGLDISALLQGAQEFLDMVVNEDDNLALRLAIQQYTLLNQKNISTVVLWPYTSQLKEFARWFRQLWAESLGKDGTGILPIQSFGPADQHSQLQFYNQGRDFASYLFLRVAKWEDDYTLEQPELAELSYLQGVSFGELTDVALEATAQSLQNHGRSVSILEIERIDEYNLGRLFMLFEVAVTYLAALLEVNAFDQPGVEESKQLIREALAS